MEQGYSEVLGKHGSSPIQSHHEHNSHFFSGCYSIFKVELKGKKKKKSNTTFSERAKKDKGSLLACDTSTASQEPNLDSGLPY